MLCAHQKAGHGVTVTISISKNTCKQSSILYVDNTNLWAGLSAEDDLDAAIYKAQEGIDSWGKLLIATGRALNPDKCKWTVHSMVPQADGLWEYRRCKSALSTIKEGEVMPDTVMVDNNSDNHDSIDDFQMTIPQATGDVAVIEQLQLCQKIKNLGLCAPLEGGTEPQFSAARNRVDNWTTNLRNSHLPTRSAWLSYNCQL